MTFCFTDPSNDHFVWYFYLNRVRLRVMLLNIYVKREDQQRWHASVIAVGVIFLQKQRKSNLRGVRGMLKYLPNPQEEALWKEKGSEPFKLNIDMVQHVYQTGKVNKTPQEYSFQFDDFASKRQRSNKRQKPHLKHLQFLS